MSYIKHKYEFVIEDDNKRTHKIEVEGIEDYSDAYNEMRSQYCKDNNIDIRCFENKYTLSEKKHKVTYDNPPWDTGKDLKKDLNSIKGISNLNYISPLQGAYGPPKYMLSTNDSHDKIKKRVKDYYGGLCVKEEGSSLFVIVSPTCNK